MRIFLRSVFCHKKRNSSDGAGVAAVGQQPFSNQPSIISVRQFNNKPDDLSFLGHLPCRQVNNKLHIEISSAFETSVAIYNPAQRNISTDSKFSSTGVRNSNLATAKLFWLVASPFPFRVEVENTDLTRH